MKDKVSIIIPSYNSEKYISRCIESILNQTYQNIEIIIVDDGSNDKSYEIYDNYKNNHKIKIIKQENSGPSKARNNGLNHAHGKYILFIDIDDYIDNKCVERLVEHRNKYSSNVIVSLKHRIVKDDFSKIVHYNEKYEVNELIKQIINGKMIGVVWGILFESKIIQQNKIKFDENTSLSEDTIFLFEYIKYFSSIIYINEFYNYYKSENSITSNKNLDKIKKNIIDSFYSTNKLDYITNYTYNSSLVKTEFRLFNYELKKIDKYKDIRYVLQDENIVNNFKIFLNSNKLNFIQKLNVIMLIRCIIVYFGYLRGKKMIKNIIDTVNKRV